MHVAGAFADMLATGVLHVHNAMHETTPSLVPQRFVFPVSRSFSATAMTGAALKCQDLSTCMLGCKAPWSSVTPQGGGL